MIVISHITISVFYCTWIYTTCVVCLLHLALAQDGIVVAPGEVDVGVVHPRALRHRPPAPPLFQPHGVEVGGEGLRRRRGGVVGAQLRVDLGHVGGAAVPERAAQSFGNKVDNMIISRLQNCHCHLRLRDSSKMAMTIFTRVS